MNIYHNLVKKNLYIVISELANQPGVGNSFLKNEMSYVDQINQVMEWVQDAGEYGLAYESIICLLEKYDFTLSGFAVVKLLEVALIFGFKTDLEQDKDFDRRG
ncbi:hypothetical protein ABQY74_009465 [Xanthomonas sp. WHRI 7064]|uniref:hypothetical protein n=1 Tax=Xanthomonas TaxID=338 RepID=UPI000CED911E|nr:hypothetical protein [Xanthomonas arboricola]NIK53764.1 hypothetical protein [Xanthomonas arboricola]PPT53372.1 hypothetical protein XarbCFBP8147_05925 [Xanthomonas arboricola]